MENLILDLLARFADGAAIHEIEENMNSTVQVTRRTLQRALEQLVENGQVKVTGKSRSTRYHLIQSAEGTETFLISTQGKEIQQLILKPLSQRVRVGYVGDFLRSYEPNVTAYLSTADKDKLRAISKVDGAPHESLGTYTKQLFDRLLIDLSWNSSR